MAVEDEPREHSPPSSRRRSAQSSKGWDSGGLRGGSTWHRPTGGSLARSTTCTTGLSVSEVLTVLDRALGVGVATSNHLLTLYSAGYPANDPEEMRASAAFEPGMSMHTSRPRCSSPVLHQHGVAD